MSIWTETGKPSAAGRRWALYALWLALPVLGLAYQIAAKQTAQALGVSTFGVAWLLQAATQPWTWVLIAIDTASFVAWMMVLAEMKLSTAVPLSAVGYVLIVGAGWLLYHEPADLLQVVGGALILIGAWLIARDPTPIRRNAPPC